MIVLWVVAGNDELVVSAPQIFINTSARSNHPSIPGVDKPFVYTKYWIADGMIQPNIRYHWWRLYWVRVASTYAQTWCKSNSIWLARESSIAPGCYWSIAGTGYWDCVCVDVTAIEGESTATIRTVNHDDALVMMQFWWLQAVARRNDGLEFTSCWCNDGWARGNYFAYAVFMQVP